MYGTIEVVLNESQSMYYTGSCILRYSITSMILNIIKYKQITSVLYARVCDGKDENL